MVGKIAEITERALAVRPHGNSVRLPGVTEDGVGDCPSLGSGGEGTPVWRWTSW